MTEPLVARIAHRLGKEEGLRRIKPDPPREEVGPYTGEAAARGTTLELHR